MAKKKPAPQFFATVVDMLALPADKIDHFCEDLRLWLHMHKQAAELQAELGDLVCLNITTPTDTFGWVDDGRHDATIKIDFSGLSEDLKQALAADADKVSP